MATFAPLQDRLIPDHQEAVHVVGKGALSERLFIAVNTAEVGGGDDDAP